MNRPVRHQPHRPALRQVPFRIRRKCKACPFRMALPPMHRIQRTFHHRCRRHSIRTQPYLIHQVSVQRFCFYSLPDQLLMNCNRLNNRCVQLSELPSRTPTAATVLRHVSGQLCSHAATTATTAANARFSRSAWCSGSISWLSTAISASTKHLQNETK